MLKFIKIFIFQIFIIVFTGQSLLGITKKKEKDISTAKKLEYIADSLLEKKEFNQAINNFLNAAKLFEKNKQWIDAVKNYRQTAWCLFLLHNTDSAIYYTNISYELLSQKIKSFNEPEKIEESEIYYTRARVFLEQAEFDSTFLYLDKGLSIIKELNINNNLYDLIIAKFYQTYGTTNSRKGNYDNSLKYNFLALSIRQNYFDKKNNNINSSYYNIALVYLAKRDYEKASQYFWNVINNNTAKNTILSAQSYNNLGVICQQKQEFDKSINYYNKAIEIYKDTEGEFSLHIAQTMSNLGKVYSLKEDFKLALDKIKTSIIIRKKCLGDTHPIIAKSLLTLGLYYYQSNNYEETIKVAKEALNILDKNASSDNLLKNNIYNLIGLTYLNLNELNEAIINFQYSITELIDNFNYSTKLNNPEIFFEGTDILNPELKILSKPSLYDNLVNKAKTYFEFFKQDHLKIDKLEQSFITYQLAFKLLNNIRLEMSSDESKYILSETEKESYTEAINICLKLDSLLPNRNYSNFILGLVDQCKSSSLRDRTFTSSALTNSNVPTELILKEKELTKKLAFYNTQLNTNSLESNTENIYKVAYNNLAVEYDTLYKYFEKSFPKYYFLTHDNQFDIYKIQSNIKDDEVIIEYFTTDNNILIITVNNKDYKIVNISIDSAFKENILKYYRSLRKVEISKYQSSNSVLYKNLIEPIKDRIENKKRIIIIPDDYLFYIPFETLYDPKKVNDQFDFRNLEYLIKDYEINYNYSLNFWMFSHNLNKTEKYYLEDFVGFAPVFDDNDLSCNDTTETNRKYFSKLEYSEKEISEISKLFKKNNKKTHIFLYDQASEDNFKKYTSGSKYIHISTHGFFNENNPDLSGLAFYKSKKTDEQNNLSTEDGLLYSVEINSLDINGDLIVLSACETGNGKLITGEGLIAINRGFIISGVPNIIYSLWNVADKKTSEFMIEFYSYLLAGKTYSQALREVKINMIKNTYTSFPKIWGSFVLI